MRAAAAPGAYRPASSAQEFLQIYSLIFGVSAESRKRILDELRDGLNPTFGNVSSGMRGEP